MAKMSFRSMLQSGRPLIGTIISIAARVYQQILRDQALTGG